jgi:PPOX class probable FMN-dependent enzyme
MSDLPDKACAARKLGGAAAGEAEGTQMPADLAARLADGLILSQTAELRTLYGAPGRLASVAKSDRLDDLAVKFISRASLVFIGSSNERGQHDVSPRGDQPGFVKVIDARTIAVPDRPGNNKLETLSNIIANPQIGMIFVVPGHDESLRLFGRAWVSTSAWLQGLWSVDDTGPKAAVVVRVEQVYPHCGRALKRARAWDPASHPTAGQVPMLAAIAAQMAGLQRAAALD